MDHLSDTPAGAGGEIQLTDALNQEIKTGAEVKGYFFKASGMIAVRQMDFYRRLLSSGWQIPKPAGDWKRF